MKKTISFSVLGGFLIFGVINNVDALAGAHFRFRGVGAEDFEKYKEKLAEKEKAVGQKRTTQRFRYRRTGESQQSNLKYRRSSSRKTQKLTDAESIISTSTKDRQRDFKAKNVDFTFRAPLGFEIESDSLLRESGSLSLGRGTEKIVFSAHSEFCEGGSVAVRECFKKMVQEKQASFKEKYGGIVLRNRNEQWRTFVIKSNALNTENTGQYLLLDLGKKRVAQFLFLEPKNKHLWEVYFESTEENGKLLSHPRYVQQMLNSFFQENKTTAVTQKKRDLTPSRKKIRTRKFKKVNAFNRSDVEKVQTANGILEMEVPKEFSVVEDTLDYETGGLTLESENSTIKFTVLEGEKCTAQSRSVIRKCIEKKAAEIKKDLMATYPKEKVLEESNLLMQLYTSEWNKEHVGRFLLLREVDQRRGVFTFREPKHKTLWNIEMSSTEDEEAFLLDSSKVRRFVDSFKFEE